MSTILCLLNKYELRLLGVDLDKYKKLCDLLNIDFMHLEIIEMSVPTISEEKMIVILNKI